MDKIIAISDFLDGIKSVGFVKVWKFEGCSDKEIEEIMNSQGVTRLPHLYVQFMKLLGKKDAELFVGQDILYDEALELKHYLHEELEHHKTTWRLPDDAFVFWTGQGYSYLYFQVNDSDDPPVYQYLSGNEHSSLVCDTFSQWLFEVYREHKEIHHR